MADVGLLLPGGVASGSDSRLQVPTPGHLASWAKFAPGGQIASQSSLFTASSDWPEVLGAGGSCSLGCEPEGQVVSNWKQALAHSPSPTPTVSIRADPAQVVVAVPG